MFQKLVKCHMQQCKRNIVISGKSPKGPNGNSIALAQPLLRDIRCVSMANYFSKALECASDDHFTVKRGTVNGTQLMLVGHVTVTTWWLWYIRILLLLFILYRIFFFNSFKSIVVSTRKYAISDFDGSYMNASLRRTDCLVKFRRYFHLMSVNVY